MLNTNFNKILFLTFFSIIALFQSVSAAGFLGFEEASGCQGDDKLFPVLLICGRNPATGACPAYTKPCGFGDLLETGRRMIIWVITALLLIIPIIISYYGFMMMWTRSWGGGADIAEWKEKILWMLFYFICLLGAWLIVRVVVDVFQVKDRINTFMIDRDGNRIKARQVDLNRTP